MTEFEIQIEIGRGAMYANTCFGGEKAASKGMKLACLVFVCFMMAFGSSGLSAAPVIADGGMSEYRIYLAPDALPAQELAAEELAEYIEKISGAKLPVVNEYVDGGRHIVVGHSDIAERLGVSRENLKNEGFAIKTAGHDLVIAGDDSPGNPFDMHWRRTPRCGTLFGVYTFLSDHLGVRWFSPGELGEYVPESRRISVGEMDIYEEPAFISRKIASPGGRGPDEEMSDYTLWLRRNRIGWSENSHFWHAFSHIIPTDGKRPSWYPPAPKEYGKTNPEYFALVGGQRRTSPDRKGYLQLCTTNPEVIDLAAEFSLGLLRNDPGLNMRSISPDDGAAYCECEGCQALDADDARRDGRWVNISDRIFTFYNLVAERVSQEFPDRLVSGHAYSAYARPPSFEVHSNVAVTFVRNGFAFTMWYEGPKERDFSYIRDWGEHMKKSGNPNLWFTGFGYGHGFWSFPIFAGRHWSDLFRLLDESGVRGVSLPNTGLEGSGAGFGGGGLENYVAARLMWDPQQDYDALMNDYYANSFGPASGHMREFFGTIKRQLETHDIRRYGRYADSIKPLYGPVEEELDGLLAAALAEDNLNPGQRHRIGLVGDAWKLVKLTLSIIRLEDEIEGMSPIPRDKVVQIRDAVKAREEYLEANRENRAIAYRTVRELDRRFRTPFADLDKWEHQLQRLEAAKQLDAFKLGEPINIAGIAEARDRAWYRTEFRLGEGPLEGEEIWLKFAAAYANCLVYVNGKKVAGQVYAREAEPQALEALRMYEGDASDGEAVPQALERPRRYDITGYVVEGNNEIAVQAPVKQGAITRIARIERLPAELMRNCSFRDDFEGWRLSLYEQNYDRLNERVIREFAPSRYAGEKSMKLSIEPCETDQGRDGLYANLTQVSREQLKAGKSYEVYVRYRQLYGRAGDVGRAPVNIRFYAFGDFEPENRDRLWFETASREVEEWGEVSALFTATRDYERSTITFFFRHPGEYRIDEASLRKVPVD